VFSTCSEPVFSALFVEETGFSLVYVFGFFVKDQLAVAVWFYFGVLYSVFVPVPCCVYCYGSVV
jgi:hypothetical protein